MASKRLTEHASARAARPLRFRLHALAFAHVLATAVEVLAAGAAWAQPSPRSPPPEAVRVLPWSSQVRAMTIDPRGFLWLGTATGLMRYDGAVFTQVGRSEIQEAVVSLAASPRGGLWIGTTSGRVLRHDFATSQTTFVGASPANEAVSGLAADGFGHVWVESGGHLFVVPDAAVRSGPSPLHAFGQPLRGERVRHLRVGEDGAVWVGTDQGVVRCAGAGQGACAAAGPNFDVSLVGGVAGSSGHDGGPTPPGVFVVSGQGMFIVRGGKTRIATELVVEALAPPIVAALPYAGGTLLADTSGVLWTDGHRVVRYRLPGIPVGAAVEAATLSADGDVWMAVRNVGIVHLRARVESQLLGVSLGEFPRPVFSVAFDRQGTLWQNAGNRFKRWDHTHWTSFTAPGVLTAYSMRGLSLAPNGDFWTAPYDRGLLRFADGEFTRAVPPAELPFDVVLSVFHDRRGRMWISGEQGGLAYKDGDGPFLLLPGSGTTCAGTVVAMAEEPTGALLFASTGGGLCRYDRGHLRAYTKADGLPSNDLVSLHLDDDGALWIGTADQGLVVRRQQTFMAVSRQAGLRLKDVASIIEDETHNLWLGTNEGLLKINKADLLAYLDGRRSTVRHLWLGTADGLRNVGFMARYAPAALRGPDGALYFPTHAGVLAVPQPDIVRSAELPRVFVDEIRIEGRNVSPSTTSLTLRSSSNLEVVFSAPRLSHPQRVRFFHRLEGLEKDWLPNRDLRVSYEDLPQGSYVLRLATASDDQDGLQETALALVVRQAFYRRPWFLAATAIVLLVLAYRFRVWTLRARFEAIAGERTRIARDMHDTLEQNLIAVKLQLEALERFAADRPQVQRHAETALNLVDQTMREAKGSIWSLRQGISEDVDLATNVSVCAGRALKGTDIKFHLQVEGKPYRLPIETEQQILRLVQEGLTNVIKHAGAQAVTALLAFGEEGLMVRLKDDGRGLLGQPARGPAQGHFGLQGMRERVTQFGGRMTVMSPPEGGFQIEFLLPRPPRKRKLWNV